MFSSRFMLNIALFSLLLILVTSVLISRQQPPALSAFSPLKPNDITSLQISYNNITTEIIKTDHHWQITKPLSIEADKFRLQAILNILNTNPSTHYQIEAKHYKKYSLQPPQAQLRLNQQSFIFGSTSAVNNKRYVLTNNKLFLIEDSFFPLFTSGYTNLMRRQLFHSRTNINEIQIANKRVFQNQQGSWQSTHHAISADQLKQFVDNWLHIQAYSVSRAQAPFSGTKVFIKTADNQSMERIVSKTDFNTVVIDPQRQLSYQFDLKAYDSLTDFGFYEPQNSADNNKR